MKHLGSPSNRQWSIILAGGEGERVRPLIWRWLGCRKPKQYCAFVGTRSMFQHTLDRALRLTPAAQTVAVVARTHCQEALAQLEGRAGASVLLQPANRDTAAGVFLAVAHVRAHHPSATVVIYPSDHFVHPEDRFLEAAQRAAWAAERLADKLVVLGVEPDHPEPEYGWIQAGEGIGWSGGLRVRSVRTFEEKPTAAQAARLLETGALWNTLVLAAKVETLWKLGWRCVPQIMPLFEELVQAIGSNDETSTLDAIYRQMPERNLSSDLLARVPERIAVLEPEALLWSDWGRPDRIAQTLLALGKRPAFPVELAVPPRGLTELSLGLPGGPDLLSPPCASP